MSGQAPEAYPVEAGKNQLALATFPTTRLYNSYAYVFQGTQCRGTRNLLAIPITIVTYKQKLGLVEAQNFVPSMWAPGAEGASGATGYARDLCDPWRPVFVFGSGRGIPPSVPIGSSDQPGRGSSGYGPRLKPAMMAG
jgi:hypothetical protein